CVQSPKDVPPKGLRRFFASALLLLSRRFHFNILLRRASRKRKIASNATCAGFSTTCYDPHPAISAPVAV
ncbi:MAG: hypothetical protein ACOY3I_04810, partial [Verrucomicrobiota bacterium]